MRILSLFYLSIFLFIPFSDLALLPSAPHRNIVQNFSEILEDASTWADQVERKSKSLCPGGKIRDADIKVPSMP